MTAQRRWNGWGDARVHEELKPEARAFLEQAVGAGQPRSAHSAAGVNPNVCAAATAVCT